MKEMSLFPDYVDEERAKPMTQREFCELAWVEFTHLTKSLHLLFAASHRLHMPKGKLRDLTIKVVGEYFADESSSRTKKRKREAKL
jgi:hypothetical protein